MTLDYYYFYNMAFQNMVGERVKMDCKITSSGVEQKTDKMLIEALIKQQ